MTNHGELVKAARTRQEQEMTSEVSSRASPNKLKDHRSSYVKLKEKYTFLLNDNRKTVEKLDALRIVNDLWMRQAYNLRERVAILERDLKAAKSEASLYERASTAIKTTAEARFSSIDWSTKPTWNETDYRSADN